MCFAYLGSLSTVCVNLFIHFGKIWKNNHQILETGLSCIIHHSHHSICMYLSQCNSYVLMQFEGKLIRKGQL